MAGGCGDVDKIIAKIGRKNISGVLLTHAHYDHIYGLNKLVGKFPFVKIYTNEFGKKELTSQKQNFSKYNEGMDEFVFERLENVVIVKNGDTVVGDLRIVETPGHDLSCLSFVDDERIFTWDAYIPRIKVTTTFPTSNKI